MTRAAVRNPAVHLQRAAIKHTYHSRIVQATEGRHVARTQENKIPARLVRQRAGDVYLVAAGQASVVRRHGPGVGGIAIDLDRAVTTRIHTSRVDEAADGRHVPRAQQLKGSTVVIDAKVLSSLRTLW